MKTRVLALTLSLFVLCALPGFAHRDNSSTTNLVKMAGVTAIDNGDLGEGYEGSNAILNANRTGDPETSFSGAAFHSSVRSGPTDLITLTITFPSAVKFDRIAWNSGSTYQGVWPSTTWSAYVDPAGANIKIVDNKTTDLGGFGGLSSSGLHEPRGAVPVGDILQHEVAGFAPVTGTVLKLEITPADRGGGVYCYSMRDVNVWLVDNLDFGTANYDDTTYLAMNGNDCLDHYLSFMGSDGQYSVSGISDLVLYLDGTTGAPNYTFDPESGSLNARFQTAETYNLPTIFHLTGGPWGAGAYYAPNGIYAKYWNDSDKSLTGSTMLMFDQFNQPFVNDVDPPNYGWDGENWLVMARGDDYTNPLGTQHRVYLKNNIQAAASQIKTWAQQDQDHEKLFIGVDFCETFLPYYDNGVYGPSADDRWGDYSLHAIKQFRHYEYDEWAGDLAGFNAAYGTSFSSWFGPTNPVDPPRDAQNAGTSPYWAEWKEFRLFMVKQFIADRVQWVYEAGIPAKRIYMHEWTDDTEPTHVDAGTQTASACVPRSHAGWDPYYSPNMVNVVFPQHRGIDRSWSSGEFCPWSPGDPEINSDYNRALNYIEAAHRYGNHVIMPMFWNTEIHDIVTHTTEPSGSAYRDFMDLTTGTPFGSLLWHFKPAPDDPAHPELNSAIDDNDWTGSGITGFGLVQGTGSTGYMEATTNTTSGATSYFQSPADVDFFGAGDNNQTIKIRMRVAGTGTGTGYVRWITETDTVWNTVKRKSFTVTRSNSAYYDYSIDVSDTGRSTGRIKQIRIYPINVKTVLASVDKVAVVPGGVNTSIWDFAPGSDVEGWNYGVNNMTAPSVAGGIWSSTVNGSDPYFGFAPGLGIVASDSHRLRIRMKITGGTNPDGAQFSWTTKANPNITVDSSVQFTVKCDGNWWIYDIPVGTYADWYGTIDTFRIDPVDNGSSQSIQIDYIKLLR